MPAQPVPLEVHQARGSNGKTLGKRELSVIDVGKLSPVEAPPMPSGLGDHGATEWLKIWTAGKWLWPDQDYHWVEQISRAYDLIDQFRAQVDSDGLMVPGQRPGSLVAHPLLAEISRYEQTIQKCLSTLGFSPTDRARLKLTELKSEKTSQDLLKSSQNAPVTVQSTVDYDENGW